MPAQDEMSPLVGVGVTLRQLRRSDALSLFTLLTDDEVVKFISPPPSSPEGYERFIEWAVSQQETGRYICFAVVPDALTDAVGLFQLRRLPGESNLAEWGFILGHAFWGTGIFPEAARLILEFTFEVMGVNRLEARASSPNGRGQGALAKIGACHEVRMRESFRRHGVWYDQVMWSILADEWRASRRERTSPDSRDSEPMPHHPKREERHGAVM
jgi:ribosomal-protein-alanine N-acetyltransferase